MHTQTEEGKKLFQIGGKKLFKKLIVNMGTQ